MGAGVPAYFHPAVAPGEWERLTRSAAGVSAVILNIDSGPGNRPDPALGAVASLAATAGIPVLGYIDTAYGTRSLREVTVDMGRYRSWYPVQGYFADQVSSAGRYLSFYEDVSGAARALGGGQLVLNHGTYPDARYADLADAIVAFEGPWAQYTVTEVPQWARELPASRFWHLVYDTPESELDAALALAQRNNAGTVYVTDRRGVNPWGGLPEYFGRHIAALGAV
jgi:hypothetical protein